MRIQHTIPRKYHNGEARPEVNKSDIFYTNHKDRFLMELQHHKIFMRPHIFFINNHKKTHQQVSPSPILLDGELQIGCVYIELVGLATLPATCCTLNVRPVGFDRAARSRNAAEPFQNTHASSGIPGLSRAPCVCSTFSHLLQSGATLLSVKEKNKRTCQSQVTRYKKIQKVD